MAHEQGIIAVAYDDSISLFNRRVYEFLLSHVWGPTSTMTGCPMSMTDGAATLLRRRINDADGDQPGRKRVFEEAYTRLVSRNPKTAWTSGQWMTERSGGSDVSGTETLATRISQAELDHEVGSEVDADGMPLGPWKIDGFKWFSSATDSEMAILLARTAKGGLSAFYMPMRRLISHNTAHEEDRSRPETQLNGVRIQRLKSKLGTKSLPTAELELRGARAYLIGSEGQGVREISAILNITRLHTAAGSVASWARGLAVALAYSKVRKVRGGLLQDNAVHLRWMANETVKYMAAAHFSFFGVALQGVMEQDDSIMSNTKAAALIPKTKSQVAALLRLILPVMKGQVSVASVDGLRQCMECLGGVGYCENNEDGGLFNIAKIYRDNLVNPIWEGTVSVMAEDVVRVILDKRIGDGSVVANVFVPWARTVLRDTSPVFKNEAAVVEERVKVLEGVVEGVTKEELLYQGRELLEHIEVIVNGAVLLFDASVNPDPIAQQIAQRWLRSKARVSTNSDWKETAHFDRAIFLGAENDEKSGKTSKL